MADHGTRNRYQAGCRCDDCRTAHREYMAASKARRAARIAASPESYEHGTVSMYRNGKCRCQACKDAAKVYDLELRRRNKAAALAATGGEDDTPTAA